MGRSIEKLETVRQEIIEDGGDFCAHVCDIRDEAAVSAAVDRVIADHGRIDGLVNNAGGQYPPFNGHHRAVVPKLLSGPGGGRRRKVGRFCDRAGAPAHESAAERAGTA